MFSKVFWLIFVLVQLAFIRSENGINGSALIQSIQSDLFEKLSMYTQVTWNYTAPRRLNIHLFPVLIKIRHNLILIKLFHETKLDSKYSQDKFLEKPYALARILDQLQNSTTVELKFTNAIFYDRRYISQRYLNDVKTYYHSEPFQISFAPENEKEVSTLINRLNFDLFYEGIDVPAFSAREKIGYYDDDERKYEAIRVPFKNGEFAMAIVLPYYNYTLESFRTFTVADYRLLLQRLNESIVINGDVEDLCDSDFNSEAYDTNEIHFKPFLVNRPFGILMYHERTAFVFFYALVRNPTVSLGPRPKFRVKVDTLGDVGDSQHMSPL